jgi:hypothetical protein
MRNVRSSFSGRLARARRLFLAQTRFAASRWRSEHPVCGSERDGDLDGFAHLWEGYLAHGRRQRAGAGTGRVILEPDLGGGYGMADFVVGRYLVEVKTAFDPGREHGPAG